ncbi:endonuclease/exonuclease/phosphatase [Panus rudis PR-1116 ss-1]|nr:endonuclease/exonuclease/phosphatase [Panus rudis PR-1116 ss-1]
MLLTSAGGLLSFLLNLCIYSASGIDITDIQGPAYQSPYDGQIVQKISGVVTAKDRYGFWLQSSPSSDPRISNGIRVYQPRLAHSPDLEIGRVVTLDARVTEYRQDSQPNDLFVTQLVDPQNINIERTTHSVEPLVLGSLPELTPPLREYSALDKGPDGWLSVPNNVSLLESVNATLQPDKYGLDFWESLEGRLVTIPNPTTCNFPDRFGSIWVYGDWPVHGKNERGGLTLTEIEGLPDAHPGTIFIGRALDGTKNPKPPVGSVLTNITGVVTYQFGYYHILPLTAPEVISEPNSEVQSSSISPSDEPCELTIGDYNVENMSPRSHHIPKIAAHIVNYLNSPDIMFLQEIQSDSGSSDNGVVTANRTLETLVKAITAAQKSRNGQVDVESGTYAYEWVDIPPVNNQDGGKPGSNIRVAYLWNPAKVSLIPGSIRGNATEAASVVKTSGGLTLSPNPGRVNPMSSAWEETRKPMAAAWQTTNGERFFTINVHMSSKRDSSSAHGNARPPVNGHIERRTHQAEVLADFVESILAHDVNASIILSGDMNDFTQTHSLFSSIRSLLTDINESSDIPPVERYTYVYDQHMQEIDQMFVSDAVVRRGTEVEHVHVNTWAKSIGDRASDHDPTVARVRVCDRGEANRALDDIRSPFVVQDSLGMQGY